MCDTTAQKWNARYASSGVSIPPPAEVVLEAQRWLPIVNTSADSNEAHTADELYALDLACGRAANAYWLADKGYRVSAWDVSSVAIDQIRSREPQVLHDIQVRDVIKNPPMPDSFDVIVVVRFLERALCPALVAALRSGGVLLYQTFTQGLSNSDYLLKSNELPKLFSELCVLDYQELELSNNGMSEARLIACKQ